MLDFVITAEYGALFIARQVAEQLGYSIATNSLTNTMNRHCPNSKQAREYGVSLGRSNSRLLTLKEVNTLITHGHFGGSELTSWLRENHFETPLINRGREELACLSTIEQVLGITLERQYRVTVGDIVYKIDGYDPVNNVAYEIDEKHHISQSEEDLIRELAIKTILNCEFKRIKI
ncbi:MAG: hypothetical protein ACRCTW_11225 [Lactococcus garvieae]